MRNLMKFSLIIGMIAVLFISACKKPEPDPIPATHSFEVLKNYLIDNGMDIPDVINGWITSATDVHDNLDNYYVIDIRSAEDFADGHIPGAVNATLGSILTAAGNSGGKPIIVACYTGQTAGHAVLALRLSGYVDAKVLKWGMCSWNNATAIAWPGNVGSPAIGNPSWVIPGSPANNTTFSPPSFTATSEDGAGILAERVTALLAGGMNKITNTDVLATPSDYFINNYWAAADNEKYGHFTGAYRINPLSLADGEYLNLNPNETVVSYCWTGQTSSMLTAYLKVLGYDAKSLLFGANGLIYDNLEAHQWSDAEIMDYELESSEPVLDGFPTLKQYLIDNSMDVSDVISGWITSASAVYENMTDGDASNDFYIIDIRGANDYAAGHIDGAVNSTLGDILTAASNANGKTIVVACYTGQTAGHGVMALRLSGYTDAMVLKWGMCSWNSATATAWPANVGSPAIGNSGWTDAPGAITDNQNFGDPSIDTYSTDGATILSERVAALLSEGMNAINNSDVLESPANYFINNYWAAVDVEQYGHVSGAYRIQPLTLAGGEYQYLNPNATVVSYCWTGQTSSLLTAYLKVLGYNSKSLLFGANGMIYDNLQAHKWVDTEINDYPLTTK